MERQGCGDLKPNEGSFVTTQQTHFHVYAGVRHFNSCLIPRSLYATVSYAYQANFRGSRTKLRARVFVSEAILPGVPAGTKLGTVRPATAAAARPEHHKSMRSQIANINSSRLSPNTAKTSWNMRDHIMTLRLNWNMYTTSC